MNDGLNDFARAIGEETKAFVGEKITEARAPLAERLDAIEKRIAALEAQPRGLKYLGVWDGQERYVPGDCVSDKGLWICMAATRQRPGESRDWQLAIRNGRDGKDLR